MQMKAALVLLLLRASGQVLPTGSSLRFPLHDGATPVQWRAPPGGCWINVTLTGGGGGAFGSMTVSHSSGAVGGHAASFSVGIW